MMLAKWMAVVFLAVSVVAEVPSFMRVCGRRNPNLDKCMVEATNALRDKLKAGIPEIDLPPQDPLHLKEFTLANSDTVKASARDVTVRGMGDFIAESMHGDLKSLQFHVLLRFNKIIIDGEYNFTSKIIMPISGQGPVRIMGDDLATDIAIKCKLVKMNGVDHLRYTSVTTSLTVKNWTAVFEQSPSMDSTLVTAINAALVGGRDEVFETLKPNIEKVISKITLDISNKVNDKCSYDELFPDRE